LDALTVFGLFAVTAMLICYAKEDRSPWFVLAFAGACALGSIYGFLRGAFWLGGSYLGGRDFTSLVRPPRATQLPLQ
jgi:hypothetical protein